VRHLAPFDDQALVAGVLLPLGAGRRAALESDAVAAEQRGNAHAHEARRIELAATLFALYQEILHARTEAEAIATHIRPEAARMLGAVETGYRAGRFSLIELADAQRQLLEIERDQIRAAAEFHTHLIEIERLTGAAMQLEDGGRTP
jgi:outer membrane protein, heavy metal efflux system